MFNQWSNKTKTTKNKIQNQRPFGLSSFFFDAGLDGVESLFSTSTISLRREELAKV